MARPVWSGSISFGLVQIPVGLHVAEKDVEGLKFTLLDEKDLSPVGYKHVNKVTGEEVPKERRVKGVEVEKDEYVVLTDEDFKAANPKATETIDIVKFVDPEEIPPQRFEKPYYLAPQKRGAKAYVLLRDALRKTGKVAIATFVLRQRQHLCAVMPHEDGLVLEILRYDHEVVELEDADVLPEDLSHVKVSPAEVQMAETLVEGMTAPFDTHDIVDTYNEDLKKLVEERRAHPEKGHHPPPKPKKEHAEVVDIMTLLKRSVEQQAAPREEGEEAEAPRRAHKAKRATRTKHHGTARHVRRKA